MFEKDAEEYVINTGIEKTNDFVVYKIKVGENAWSLIVEPKEELSCSDWIKIYEGSEESCHKFVDWQNGAEFGYNKALEEIGDLRDCCNCKHWHYSTRSLSYYCDKTDKTADYERQGYHCDHWER